MNGIGMIRRFGAIATVIFAVLLPAAHANAQSKIAVVVNDTAITSYEIGQRARLLRLITRKSSSYTRSRAREELINEALQLHEAAQRGVTVSGAQVEQAYASIAERSKLTAARLSSILKSSGVNPKTLKDRLKAQIAWSSLIRSRFQATVKVHEQDVIYAMQRKKEETAKVTMLYDLYQVAFIIPRKSPKSMRSKQKSAANAYYKSFKSCDADLARMRGKTDIVVKRIGERLESDIRPQQRESLKGVEVNQVTKPQESAEGVLLLAVCGKRELQSDAAARSVVEDELKDKRGELLARRYLRDLRRNAVIIVK